MVVVLLGPPGVGKGTQAVRLVEELGARHVSTGDLLRAARREGTELGQRAEAYMDKGELVPDELVLDLVRDHLGGMDAGVDVIFDGFPRTTDQATGLDAVLAPERQVDAVVLFEAPDETLVRRLSGRRSCPDCGGVFNIYSSSAAHEGACDRCDTELVHRVDDEPETVKRRLQVYQEQTAPLIAFYEGYPAGLSRIAADRSADEIYGDFRAVLKTTVGDAA